MDLAKELILAVRKKDLHSGYGLQKECEALVGHVLQNMVKTNLPSLVTDVKNEQDCLKFREEGNYAFVTGEDDVAIEKYTMSLAYATNDESMAYAFANRSAALYRKNFYRECLLDIDAALSHGYPTTKLAALSLHADHRVNATTRDKAENLSALKEFMRETRKSSCNENDATCDLDELTTIDRQPRRTSNSRRKNDNNDDSDDNKLVYGPSDEAPVVSKGIEIAYSQKYGRHLIAKQHFKPGDVLLMERPYAYVIYRENRVRNTATVGPTANGYYSIYYTHCHHCLERCHNLIPCPHCPLAQYCSKACRLADWNLAHDLECPVQSILATLLHVDKDKIRILTKIIRLLIVATKKGKAIDELRNDLTTAEKNTDHRTAGFTDNGVFDGMSARAALSLATNLAVRPLMEVSAFSCISALSVILLALKTTFFGKRYTMEEMSDIGNMNDVKFCATIVFRNCVVISSNSFSIQIEPGVKVGSGLYVTGSLMNHSCAPNTFRHFHGLTMITRALHPIKPGEQIFTYYGGGYQNTSRDERKRKMSEEYFFDCDCVACRENWPTYTEILQNHIGSIAKSDKKLVEKLKPYRQRLLTNQYDIDAVKCVINTLYKHVRMPCEEILHAMQYLKSYYLDA